MKHLKQFYELFDTEELKDQLEFAPLQGKLDPKNLIKGGSLSTFNGDGSDYAIIVDKESNGVHFILKNKTHIFVFSIRNIKPHRYDVMITFEKTNTEFVEPVSEYYDININDIYDIIESDLIPSLKEGGFNDVLDFQKREQSKINFLKN